MKKLFVLFLVVCALPALVGCFGGSNDSTPGYNSNPIAASVDVDNGTVSVDPAVLEGAKAESAISVYDKNGKLIDEIATNDENIDKSAISMGTIVIKSALKQELLDKGAVSAKVTILDKNGNKQVITANL